MKYLNKRTGAVIDVPCPLQGDDWEEITEAKKAEPKVVKAEAPAKAAKAEPAGKTPAKAAAKKTAKKG